jgi:hypothetical protein
MPSLTLADVKSHHPDLILPPDPEFADDYHSRVWSGIEAAHSRRVAFVAICRNAMPFLPLTLQRVTETASYFKDFRCFIFENDSQDGTKECLAEATRTYSWLTVESRDNGRPHLNFTKDQSRTVALAEYRNQCREWVAENCRDFDYTVVFDTDSWGGWSPSGVNHTVACLESEKYSRAYGMASYSWCEWGQPVWPQPTLCHYDAWACRWTWWKERQDMLWFHLWHPPVGSEPVKMNSAFGQLAVYRTQPFIAGQYVGDDCEHVGFHKSIGGEFYLNPSMRSVSFWIPKSESNDRPV